MGVANGVGKLNLHPVGQSSGDDIFCNISAHVGCATVHLGGVFPAKGTTAVATCTAVRIDDNFSSGQSAVSFRAADHKAACWIHEEFSFAIEHRRREYTTDQFFCDELFNLTVRDVGGVLGGYNHGGDSDRFRVTVFDRDLGFCIGSKPRCLA